jgi:hypothetical protein
MEREVILEQSCQYKVYPDPKDVERAKKIYADEEDTFVNSYLHALKMTILAKCPSLLRRYLWHDRSFNLNIQTDTATPCLYGKVVFGDGLEDEWFITFLLLEVSKAMPDLIISISDTDGEFLLIEAAEHLPEWLEPESSANRIFIAHGKVHIVGIEDLPQPTLRKSLELIRKDPFRTTASKAIQQTIEARVCKFRTGQQELHHARVIIPKTLAVALTIQPNVISPIVSALNDRQPSDLNRVTSNKLQTAEGSLELQSIRVRFTRLQFAYLLCQQIHPPRGYPMPVDASPDYFAANLGLKLYVGAQLSLLKQQKSHQEHEGGALETATKIITGHFGIQELVNIKQMTLDQLLKVHSETNVQQYFGHDDDLGWMDVEDGPIINEIASKMQGVQLSPKESEEVVQKMLDEEDNPTMNRRLADFMKASSNLDGIYYNQDDPIDDDEDEDDSTEDDSSLEPSSAEEQDDFLEKEILEAVMHDPDLLMKILEKGADLGLDSGDLLERLKKLEKPDVSKGGILERQKGLADIDPEKVKQARTRSRPLPPSVQNTEELWSDEEGGEMEEGSSKETAQRLIVNDHSKMDQDNMEEWSSSEDIEGLFEYPVKPPKATQERPGESDFDFDSGSDSGSSSALTAKLSIQEYINAMDAELLGKACDRHIETQSQDILKSTEADSSPTHTILLSIH